ncbi:MAG: sugar kinase [Gemmataceae bacterium]|nr:sugar kinase [Gemmataceae bacterium]MCS7271662.1 sugar kinase [Gemmataceae bacterium]MDW8242894.1 sugar kinase [Thermogemmata sp.]
MAEIVTFGEAMIRLSPPRFQRLEQARCLEVEIGGAELNTAVGLARLGHAVAWVSVLPAHPLGRLIANRVRETGVDDRWVRFSQQGRCGLYFLEFGAAPRPTALWYDRQDSAMARLTPGQFDWDRIFEGARWFHVSGITPALSDGTAGAVMEALQAARRAQLTISLDLNYRARLWDRDKARQVLSPLIPYCQVLFASEADAEYLFGIQGESFVDIAAQWRQRFGVFTVIATRRESELVWRNRLAVIGANAEQVEESPWYEVEIVDRLGAGDAMAAGVIHGLLTGDLQKAVQYGAALAALKHTIAGDLPWINPEEVEATIRGDNLNIRR